MAFKKPTSFLTDPSDEQADYLAATTPVGPRYVAPDPKESAPDSDLEPNAYSPITPSASPSYVAPDPDLDPNAYSPVQLSKAAQLRQEEATLAGQRPQDKPAGFWRTMAGIGAGIGVGYLTRNPHMIASVQEQIMHPGAAKVRDWAAQVNDKELAAQQQEKIEDDAQAGPKRAADLAHINAETRYQNAQADNLGRPDAPKEPTPITEKVQVVGPDGKSKTEIHFIPDPNHPEKYSVLGIPPSAEGGPKNEFEGRLSAYKAAHGGQEPDEATIASWARPTGPRTKDDWIAIASDPKSSPELLAQANKALKLHTDQALASRPERPERAPSESALKDKAINEAFQTSGRDWNQVKADVEAGKYTDHASDIYDHADKMLKLNPQEQQKVETANTVKQQAQRALDAINLARAKHPNLIGDPAHHPFNSLTRWSETAIGAEPPEVAAADTALEGLMAMQPGQHGFRSKGAEEGFKKAAGIDSRGKPDGSHAWLIHPDNTIAGLQELVATNDNIKANILKQRAKPQAQQVAPNAAPSPAAIDPTLKAYADQYFGGDIQKAIAYNQAHGK